MPDKPKPDAEPTEVTVVNPEPIPVKIEITNQTRPADTTLDTAARVAEVREDKVVELAETALQLRLAAKDLADRLERADERKAKAEDKRTSRLFWQAIILGAIVALPGAIAAWKTQATHNAVNSRMDQMKELIEKSSYAEGLLEGKANRGKDAE